MYTTKKRTYYVLGTIVLTLSTVLSCKKATVKEVLTDDSYCYWHYIAGRATTDTMNYYGCCREESVYMYFDKFENCIQFDGRKKHFSEFNGYDYQYIPTWNITKDSILDMTGITFIVKKYTKEMIILSSQTGRIDTLEKISNIDIPKNYRKYQKSIFCTRRLLKDK